MKCAASPPPSTWPRSVWKTWLAPWLPADSFLTMAQYLQEALGHKSHMMSKNQEWGEHPNRLDLLLILGCYSQLVLQGDVTSDRSVVEKCTRWRQLNVRMSSRSGASQGIEVLPETSQNSALTKRSPSERVVEARLYYGCWLRQDSLELRPDSNFRCLVNWPGS